jgi:hypothetical protein
VSVSVGMIWEDMVRYSRNARQLPSLQFFCRSAR